LKKQKIKSEKTTGRYGVSPLERGGKLPPSLFFYFLFQKPDSDYYEQDKSSLIKYSLKELYEDIIDRQIINEYETKEKNDEINFIDSNGIMNMAEG